MMWYFPIMQPNGPWLYGVASLRDLSVSNRDEPRWIYWTKLTPFPRPEKSVF